MIGESVKGASGFGGQVGFELEDNIKNAVERYFQLTD
jgi:hypothetical protein